MKTLDELMDKIDLYARSKHGRSTIESALRELIADAERWEKVARELGWKAPEPVQIWYMRDNHTFASLPLDLETAMVTLRETFDGPCGRYGMLCSKQIDGRVHARADWASFEPEARAWISAAIDHARKG